MESLARFPTRIFKYALCFSCGLLFHSVVFHGLTGGDQTTLPKSTSEDIAFTEDARKSIEKHLLGRNRYEPCSIEQYFMDHMEAHGWNATTHSPMVCDVWKTPNATTPEIFAQLQAYKRDIEAHTEATKKFKGIPNLMKTIQKNALSRQEICKTVKMHENGLLGLFPSQQLSLSTSGYIDPLLPPMRDIYFCEDKQKLMSMDYLVHDFEAMCHLLKPHSKLILIDMGASLDFHDTNQPIVNLLELYEKFGFHFDHIYGFEISKEDPDKVFDLLPEKYLPAYHWINVGVSDKKGHKLNPLDSILRHFDEDDLIVVKLDIDTPHIENKLAKQLLEDEDSIYSKLVDQFYFEHHVRLGELQPYWGTRNVIHSIADSFNLFQSFRRKGIPAHFWP